MKIREIITLLILGIAIPTFGQYHIIGIKGGINWTNINSTNFLSSRSKIDNGTGVNAGLIYEYSFNKRFNLGIDLLFLQKGFRREFIILEEDGIRYLVSGKIDSEFDYDYFSIPIKGGVSIGNKFLGFVNLGIIPSILNKATITTKLIDPVFTSSGIGYEEETTQDQTDKITRFDFSGLIELGLNYNFFDHYSLFASVGYQYSFTSITNQNYFPDGEVRHTAIVLSFGIKYALRKG